MANDASKALGHFNLGTFRTIGTNVAIAHIANHKLIGVHVSA